MFPAVRFLKQRRETNRRKLQLRAPELRFIHTVRGVGFRLSNDVLRPEVDRRELVLA